MSSFKNSKFEMNGKGMIGLSVFVSETLFRIHEKKT